MRYFTVFLFCLLSTLAFSQQLIKGVVRNEYNKEPLYNVSVINLTSLKVSKTNNEGQFSIEAKANDILHVTQSGFKPYKLKITQDWIDKNQNRSIYITEDVEVLDEIVINNLRLTGILQIDTRLIAFAEYPYTRDLSYTGYSQYTGFNPVGNIYRSFKNSSKSAQQINKLQEENEILELMKSRYDRDLVTTFLDISKVKLIETLQTCNYSEEFIYTATDYQVFVALKTCINTK